MRNLKDRQLITHLDPKSVVSEAFRTLRTNIQYSSIDKELSTLMVTSSGPTEGKSTITANLAVVMAQSGKNVLLIDTDLRKPTVHRTFRMLNNEGLTNLLTSFAKKKDSLTKMESDLFEENAAQEPQQEYDYEYITSYVKSSDIENLAILTTGPIPPNPAELLGSQAMSHFMKDVVKLYDLVIFDTPPVLAVTDAQLLSTKIDGVVLVVDSGKTSRDMAIRAKEQLEKVKANILGCVLNNREMKKDNYYYYYG